MNTKVKKFGILCSGGDAPGLNAAIRSLCMTAILQYGMEAYGSFDGYRGLIEGNIRKLEVQDVENLLGAGGTFLGTSRVKPFKNPEPDSVTGLLPVEAIKKNIEKWNLDALVCLGGNGTNSTASLLSKEGINVIGLPKTIDNDIEGTEVTFGFHTAIDIACDSIERIRTTACSHSRIMVVEVMGHKAGWLGLYSAVGSGADVVLLPEIPYDIRKVAEKIKSSGKKYSIVVVAEGAKNLEESRMDKKTFKKSRALMTTSIGGRVAKELEELTGIESRVTVLGYLQRGGIPSAYDRILATMFGSEAAHFLSEGKFGKLVAMRNGKICGIDLSEVEGKVKKVPILHPMVQSAKEMGMYFGD